MNRFPGAQFGFTLTGTLGCCLLTGCALIHRPSAPPTVAADIQPVIWEGDAETASEPDSARAHTVNLFGEMPDRGDVPYFTRTASSLLRHTTTEEGADFDPCISPDGKWLVFASTRHNVSPDLYYKRVDGVAVTQLTSDPGADIQPAFSPDGKRVAFASDRSGNWDIYVVELDGSQPVQITDSPGDEIHPSWSPDATRLVYCCLPLQGQWELWVADATNGGGNNRFIGYGLFPEWSPVNDTIVYQRARERGSRWFSIWTMEFVGGEPRYPTEVAAAGEAALITPSWSRDGTRIAYASVTPSATPETIGASPQAADIWIVDADGRNRIRLTDGFTANFGPAWSPADRVFFTSGREGREAIWSLSPMTGDDAAKRMAAGAPSDANGRTEPRARTASDE